MPTYDYRCEACRHELDVFQGIKDAPLTVCPRCGAPRLRRLIGTGAGIIFKGSGFYETDYKRARAPGSSKTAGRPDKKDTSGSTSTPTEKTGNASD